MQIDAGWKFKLKKVLIVYNPVSGWWPSKSVLFDLICRLSIHGYIPEVYVTQKEKSTQRAVSELVRDDCELVICCGGDGTLHETINGLLKADLDVPLGYIPLGTTNDFGSTHDIPSDFNEAYELIKNGEVHTFDVGLFDNSEYFTYIACFGIFTRLTYEASQPLKNILGYLAYYIEGAKDLGRLQRSYHLKVETDEETYEGDYIFGAVVNSLSFAGIFQMPITTEQLSDGYMEVILIKVPDSLSEFPTVAESLLKKDYKNNDKMLYFKTKKIKFSADEPIAWNIDGEFAGNKHDITIEVKDKMLNIIL